jgi:hypothetical protein
MGITASSVAKVDYNEPVNEITNKFIVKNMMSCNQNTDTKQEIEISGLKCGGKLKISGLSQTSVVAPTVECIQKNLSKASQINKLKSDLKAGLEKEIDGVVLGAAISVDAQTFINKAHNKIVNAVTSESTLNCIQSSLQKQIVKIKNNEVDGDCDLNNFTQNITNNALLKCKQANKTIQDVENRIQSVIDTSVSSKVSGITLDWLKWIAYGLVVLLAIYVIYKFSGDYDDDDDR